MRNLASIHIVASLATDTLLERLHVNLAEKPFGDSMTPRNGMIPVPQDQGSASSPICGSSPSIARATPRPFPSKQANRLGFFS